MDAISALRVEVAIARVIGEPLFRAFMDRQKTGATEEEQGQSAASAIGLLASKMDADELLKTMQTVFESVSCEGQPTTMATFNGRNKELWLVFMEALKVNFSDFLPVGLFTSLADKIPKPPTQ